MTIITQKHSLVKKMLNIGFLVAAATVLISLTPATNAEGTSRSLVIMEGADVLLVTDLEKVRNSSISKELEKMQKGSGNSSNTPLKLKKYEELGKELQKTTGLKEKDFKTFELAGKLDDVAMTKDTDIQTLNIAFALTLGKPLTLEKLEEALRKAAATNDDVDDSTFSRTAIGKHEVLAVTNDQKEANLNQLLFTSVQDNKTILGGTRTGLKSALTRIDSDSIRTVQEEFGGWPRKDGIPHIGIIFNPTQEMLAKAKKQAEATQQKSQQQPKNQAKEAFMKILPHIKRLVLSVDCEDKMYFTLNSLMDSAKQAQALTSLLQQSVISMTQATITMLTGGQKLNFTQSLNAKVADNTRSVLSFQLSKDDIERLQQMSKQMSQDSRFRGGKKSRQPLP